MSCKCNTTKSTQPQVTQEVSVQSTESSKLVARDCGGFEIADDPTTMDCGSGEYCAPRMGRLAAFALKSSDGVSDIYSSDGITQIGSISYI